MQAVCVMLRLRVLRVFSVNSLDDHAGYTSRVSGGQNLKPQNSGRECVCLLFWKKKK